MNNYSNEELARTWYIPGDYISMKRRCQLTIDLIEQGIISGDCETYCSLGLKAIRERRDKRTGKTMVQKGVDAVLEEQTEQMCLGITDAEAIASAYVDAIRSEAADSAPTHRSRNAEKRQRRIAVVLPRIIKNRIRRRKDDK